MFGRTALPNNTVQPTRVSADGSPLYKVGGVTIDWSSVTAVASTDATLTDGSVIKVGQKYLRYGQILTKITTGTTQTFTGTATGGTITYTFVRTDNGNTVTTAAVSATATAAVLLAAIQAVAAPGQAVSASGGALGTNPVIVTFGTATALGTISNTAATGGTVTVAQTTAGTTGGFFGPYDPSASDGRQTLTRGECFILDETLLQYGSGSSLVSAVNDQVGGVFDGGRVFIDRVLHSGTASHTLALGPTKAEFLTAFPAVQVVEN
jgi:hypothetical protein